MWLGVSRAKARWTARGAMLVCAAVTVSAPRIAAAQGDSTPADSHWVVHSQPHVELWFHGLAVVEFSGTGEFPLYNIRYAERVRAAKEEMGVYPTPLDRFAEKLRGEFEGDPVFQILHFIPLYFPSASREQMLRTLMAVAEARFTGADVVGPSTREGFHTAAEAIRDGKQRRVLARFVEALGQEWDVFFGEFWERTVAADSARYAEIQRQWDESVAPALKDFLRSRRLDGGKIFVSPALGPEGRLVEGVQSNRSDNVVAVWSPPEWDDPRVSVYSVVRELCFSIVGGALRAAGVRAVGEEDVSGHAAVRCGSLLFESYAPALVDEYRSVFVRTAGADTEDTSLADAFETAYQLDESVLGALRERIQPTAPRSVGARSEAPPAGDRWVVRSEPHVDLWFHALAVIAADQPGPLGLYSADYARRIREIKQELGVYPTVLDSLGPKLQRGIAGDPSLELLHFVPLYFPRAEPERLLQALRAVVRRRIDDPDLARPDVQFGIRVMSQNLRSGSARRTLESLVEAVEQEWEIFYRQYWERLSMEQASRYAAIQSMWDSQLEPQIGRYLKDRRINAGLIVPSPGLGPEGRIIDIDEFNPRDQVVAVQLPLSTDRPEGSVFAFLKELCFLLVDPEVLRDVAEDEVEFEDLRRRAAVRCGALILEFYAPTLVGRYRRVFLDAVGAEESSTARAFERVYALDPEVLERVREQVRRR